MMWVLVGGALLAGFALWARLRLVVVTVQGASMEPTFHTGDRVLVRRLPLRRVRVGDVVVLGPRQGSATLSPHTAPGVIAYDNVWLIKRAAAVPGDPVPRDRVPALAEVAEATVPAGKLVLLGDGPHSGDSRQRGYFGAELLVGVAIRRLRRQETTAGARP